MTENKRFTPRQYENGQLFLEDNQTNCFYEIKDSFGNVEILCERLNKLNDEKTRLYNDNIRVKQLITEAHSNERTAIGKSVLLQIIEQL